MITAVQVPLFLTALFPSSAAALIFSVVFLLWPLSEIIGGGIIPFIRRGGARTRRRDRGSVVLIYVSIVVSLTVAFSFATAGVAMFPSLAFYPGMVLMVAGIAFRQWAIAVLGRFFSAAVRVQKGQTVVDTGPYRYVRHPSYTGALMIFVGLGLVLQSWGAVLVLALIFAVVIGTECRWTRSLNLRAWRSLHFIFAEDEKTPSFRSLNGSSTPHGAVRRLAKPLTCSGTVE
jgi:protein-S-isoprenylcysteine O-methyltransferase